MINERSIVVLSYPIIEKGSVRLLTQYEWSYGYIHSVKVHDLYPKTDTWGSHACCKDPHLPIRYHLRSALTLWLAFQLVSAGHRPSRGQPASFGKLCMRRSEVKSLYLCSVYISSFYLFCENWFWCYWLLNLCNINVKSNMKKNKKCWFWCQWCVYLWSDNPLS